jgi:hypothetical protein
VLPDGGSGPISGELSVYAVSPVDPDVLYAVVSESVPPQRSDVIRSADHGQSWTLLFNTPNRIGSIAVDPDGAQVWVGTDGLIYQLTADGGAVALALPTKNGCVFRDDQRLYACGWPTTDGFAVGKATIGAVTFVPFLTWDRITGALSCPMNTPVASKCPALFPALEATLRPADGGVPASDAGSAPGPPSGCHCDASGTLVGLAFLGLLAAAPSRRSRSRTRRAWLWARLRRAAGALGSGHRH